MEGVDNALTTFVEISVVMSMPLLAAFESSACHTGMLEVISPFPSPVMKRPIYIIRTGSIMLNVKN
jgi:hypothetical protein